VRGITNAYVDYYVTATDARGNTFNSPIQHVWVGAGSSPADGGGDTNGCSGRVCVAPSPPVAGEPVTIYYDPTGGPLGGTSTARIHLGWNNWSTVVSPDPVMTFNAASNRWEFTTNVPPNVTRLSCVFNNGSSIWDNNNGQDWHFAVVTNSTPQPPLTPTGLTATPVNTNQINLAWSAAFAASGYVIRRDGTAVGATANTAFADSGLTGGQTYCYTITATNSLGASAPTAAVCTNTPVTVPPPGFVMDGTLDFAGYVFSTNGPGLYAALRGTTLYVATASPGTSGPNDHFIFVTDELLPGATGNAPWAKSGKVAVSSLKPYLATESQNTYVAWYNAPAGSQSAKSANTSGVLEGTIDLAAAFGAMPTNIYLCAAAYATADGGALVSQSPAGSGPDIDPGEFFVIPVMALRDQNGDGKFDRIDPQMDFRIEQIAPVEEGMAIQWAAMPGRAYKIISGESVLGPWSDLPGSLTNAGSLQLTLSFTAPRGTHTSQRFYKVQLMP
jgi:hypothetical protein